MNQIENKLVFDIKKSKDVYLDYKNFYKKKNIPLQYSFNKTLSNDENLSNLSIHLLNPAACSCDMFAYKPLIIELSARLIFNPQLERIFLKNITEIYLIEGSQVLSSLSVIMSYTKEVSILIEHFLTTKDFFHSLKNCYSSICQSELQLILLSFYRLLVADRQKFYKFVDPQILHSIILLESTSNINKYLSILILSKYLFFSEIAKIQMIEQNVNQDDLIGVLDGDLNINYKFLQLLEAQRLSNLSKLSPLEDCFNESIYTVTFNESDFSPGVSIISGVMIPNLISLQSSDYHTTKADKSVFVELSKSINAIRSFAEYTKNSEPILLVGSAGTGKTFLVNEMARRLNIDSTNNLVKIHLNQQTDSKSLLGTYTSGTKPGTFEWKNGVLTTAVKEGKWVFVEDIDKAPNEVLSLLMGLLEHREITLPSRGEVLKAGNGFQLISTIRTTPAKNGEIHLPDMIGLRLWKVLTLPDLDENDLKTILNKKFPLLTHSSELFIKCYFAVKNICDSRKFVSMNKGAQSKQISIRDLMKLCKRCDHIFKLNDIKSSDDLIHDEIFDMIFQEAIDCFTSAIVEEVPIEYLIREIGSILEIPTSRINLQLSKHVPVIDNFEDSIKIGRAYIEKHKIVGLHKYQNKVALDNTTSFATTNHSARLMEKIGVGVSMCEPILLVGETGTGKTTVVQQMAKLLNEKLTVINLSQQTEVSDLLGGFKPVNAKTIALPLEEDFEQLFARSFSTKNNAKFLKLLSKCFNKSQWKNVCRLWKEAYKMAKSTFEKNDADENLNKDDDTSQKKKRKLNEFERSEIMKEWESMQTRVSNFEKQVIDMKNSFVFKFVEGSLVNAVKRGDWLLLDEINLASPETLDSISDLLAEQIDQRSVLLSEKGDIESVKASINFRIFGCMNPATDVGKKDLPQSIRSRFTEIYVASPDQDIQDLLMIIDKYIGKYTLSDEWIGNDVAELYYEAKKLSDNNQIVDGANQKPHFSIRTLTRTLLYARDIASIYGLRRSLYEGFCMSLLTLLDARSEKILLPLIQKYTIGRLKNVKSVLSQVPANPSSADNEYIQFKHYWMKKGSEQIESQQHYIITPFVEKNMMNLVRATSGRRFPILIQGPTSAGKTSMINYLAKVSGHKFVRINNHEHTDLQEYLGTYVSDDSGKLIFKEGILVEALRNGHWIVLDELNLAPTDVLEALNRLLDDNRELFIPETQEVVRPHPDFMLFATQNPPGLYGGRKVLSKAFRNRFLELHFDDIPQDELEIILRERCKIAPSYAKKIVEVYKELGVKRQSARLFEQKHSFATLRDLFRWAQREAIGYEELAANGYMLLAERVRRSDEKIVVKEALEKVMRVKLDMDKYYSNLEVKELLQLDGPVIWTKAMRRLAVLVMTSMKNNEPLLLVGETGCGKTTVCQMVAKFFDKDLIIVNAHQNTETGDLLGAQRPIRNRSELQQKYIDTLKKVVLKFDIKIDYKLTYASAVSYWKEFSQNNNIDMIDKELMNKIKNECDSLFEWNDGPLVTAMKSGSYFLLDEISLADDSVLERLNSVLEPERSLLLAEKGTDDILVVAHQGFQFLATMNPGGDYGKKELSPALRNRFTEIWVPSMEDFTDVTQIVRAKLNKDVKSLTEPIVNFSRWYGIKLGGGDVSSGVISLRDIIAWITFINTTERKNIPHMACLLHGACMVFIDALGTHNTAYLADNEEKLRQTKIEYVKKLSEFAKKDLIPYFNSKVHIDISKSYLRCGLFEIEVNSSSKFSFNLEAPTTACNAMRVIRALQVHKPILLEGSPGVGKTSLITALAQATGNKLTRINLSDQTDLIDLFGSDSPVEGGKAGEFVWRDAPYLRAMQKGEWVLLDEMNLASQSVLEGLNACLDHRGEVYIPELDKCFISHPNFKVFAAQNPQLQGGGRKGLPKSFINRFSVVYVDMLNEEDLKLIAYHLYPSLDRSMCDKMISFMSRLEEDVVIRKKWGSSGSPWEFNLRDTLRWLSLVKSPGLTGIVDPADFFDLVVRQRFRTEKDRKQADDLFESIFSEIKKKDPYYVIQNNYIQCQNALLNRNNLVQYRSDSKLYSLQCNTPILETIFRCIQQSSPVILVGASGSGKSSLIKFAADIIGAKVYEFSMNSDIDSMDILGGYEQADYTRTFSRYSSEIIEFLYKLISVNSQLASNEYNIIVQISTKLVKILSDKNLSLDNINTVLSDLENLNKVIQNEECLGLIDRVKDIAQSIKSNEININFEWFDGLLVKAVEKGYWLILDNANLCSPSVLDRLNSLLETNGSLVINEFTLDDGSPRIIETHPNFRLFLTSDPKYGELSRAMRNRSVEIFVESLSERATTYDKRNLGLPVPNMENASMNEKMNSLNLVPHYRPLTAFTDPNDSFSMQTSLFIDYYNEILKSQNVFDTSIFLQFIPISLINLVSEILFSATESPEFTNSLLFQKIQKHLEFTQTSGIIRNIQELYKTTCSSSPLLPITGFEDFSNFPLSCLTNKSVSEILKKKSYPVESSEISYLFAILSLLSDAFTFMDDLHTKSKIANASVLNPLQQLAAVVIGRELKKVPKLNVYKWLIHVLSFIRDQFFISIKAKNILSNSDCFKALFRLMVIWKNFVSASTEMNNTAIRVYQDKLIEWYEQEHIKFDATLVKSLNRLIVDFSKELKLSRGSSMSLIWNHCRGSYPQTAISWRNYEKLTQLAKRFDEVAYEQFPENINNVNDFRKMFVDLFSACMEENMGVEFDEMMSFVKTKVENLSDITNSFLFKRAHPFADNFVQLLGFIESQHTVDRKPIPLESEMLSLCLLSNKQTIDLLEYGSIELFKPYPIIMKSLWENSGSLKLPLFDDSFFKSTMSLVSDIEKTGGGSIDQTLFDLKLFISALIKHSPEVLADHISYFATILFEWINFMSDIHIELLDSNENKALAKKLFEDCTESSLKSYCKIFMLTGHTAYCEIFETFFIPSLIILRKPAERDIVGKSFFLASCGFIMLYMPDSAYDPAAVDHILYNDFVKLQELVTNIKESFIRGREIYFGDVNITAEKYLPVIEEDNINKVPRVFRDSHCPEQLFDEWHLFFDSYIDKTHIEFLLKAATEVSDRAQSQIQNFIENASSFVLRLKENYLKFSDLNDILTGFIYGLKLGLTMLHDSYSDKVVSVPSSLWISDAAKIFSPFESKILFENTQKAVKNVSVNDFNVENIYSYLLTISNVFSNTPCLDYDFDTFNKILMALYYRWSLRLLKQQEKESVDNGIYKFSDPTMDAEADFRKLFPDSDQIIDINISHDITPEDNFESVYFSIARAYMMKFNLSTTASFDEVASSSIIAFNSFKKIDSITGSSKNTGSTLIFILSLLHDSYIQFTKSKPSSEIDFYNGFDFAETRKAGTIIRKLQVSVHELLNKWPEHATLSELFRICNEFLQFSSSTPIFRLLTKVEQIFTFIAEWEKYAHSGVSLSQHYRSISGLIVSWRQLELASWKQVFINEEKHVEKRIGKWWFHLFETIIVPVMNDEIFDEEIEIKIISAINIFLSQSTYGEFQNRLNLLGSFALHVKEITPDATIQHALNNIISFYKQFLNIVEDSILSTKKDLEKKVNEIILLASWKDVNIDALKQSSHRSHHNLYKIIRKYRDCLVKPIKPLVENGISASIKTIIDSPELNKDMIRLPENISDLNKLCSEISIWNERNPRMKNILQVEKNMNVYITSIENVKFRSLHEFAKDLIEQSENLRKETPKEFTKENKNIIGSLKNEKHKLLSDTIKSLREMGLKLHKTLEIQKSLPSVTAILATSLSLDDTLFSGCDLFYFRILDLLPKLRVSVSEVHSDIPSSEAEKCLAAAENLIYNLTLDRVIFVKFSKFHSSLKELLSNLNRFSIENTNKILPLSKVNNLQFLTKQARIFVNQFPKILEYAIQSLSKATEFTEESYDSSIFINARSNIKRFMFKSFKVLGSEDLKKIDELHTFYVTFKSNLLLWKAKYPHATFVADFVEEWLEIQNFDFCYISDTMKNSYNIADLETSFRELFNAILVSVQRIFKFNAEADHVDEINEYSSWLTSANKRLNKFADLLYPVSILKKFNKCITILQNIEFTDHETLLASALIEHISPITQHYFNLVRIVEYKLKSHHIDVSKGTFELATILHNICTKGFCQPEPPSDEKEDNNLKEGTGLGDGEGAQNKSNDVEDDEDLGEQAQQPNEDRDKDENNEEDNDDAVDIEGDMAGDLENASDQENDENEEEDKGEDDLDEEIDNLDDMDPNAVDDKMWDEEASSNSKEKESEDMPDNCDQNNDMEAKEEESEDNKKDNKDTENNNKHEDQESAVEDQEEIDENDDDAENEEGVGEQEDEVKNEENDQFDNIAPEADALELPEDMNLDSDGEESDGEEENAENFDDNLDDESEMKDEENRNENEENVDVEMDKEEPEGDDEDGEVEGTPAGDEDDEDVNSNNSEDENTENGMDIDDEMNEEIGVDNSDDELKEGDKQEDDEKINKEDSKDDVEGLDGTETGTNDIDDETAVKQQSGSKSEGADADAEDENENVGASNGGADFQEKDNEENNENKEETQNETSRNKAAESMKKLGDSLKEFHRRRQEIKEVTDEDLVDQKSGERPDEFQHLEGDNADSDTQALGAANKDQIQSINDEMAIDDDENDENENDDNKEAEESTKDTDQSNNEKIDEEDVEMKDANVNEDDFAGEKRSGFVNEINPDLNEIPANLNIDNDANDLEEEEEENSDEDISQRDDYDIQNKDHLRDYEESEELWKKADEKTRDLTSSLCEQLRLILEPTLSTKLKGDYKTGKRLNMKRIIPYIASQFRKDKIWMRRTKPSKRQYQIMISLDDSKSMAESHAVDIAFESVALVSKALSQLESGQLSIMKFGTNSEVVHPFEKQFGSNSGIDVFREFKFDDTRTDIKKLVAKSLKVFNEARSMGDSDLWQLEIVISDGVCEDHETIQRLVRKAREEKVMIVFVIIDGLNSNESILDMSQASYIMDENNKMKLQVSKYLDTFPFEFYVVVHHINELPEMLSLILRQYFTELASS